MIYVMIQVKIKKEFYKKAKVILLKNINVYASCKQTCE